MQFEIQASHLSQKFLVDAPNWLSALRQGLRQAGEDDSVRNLQCDILDENDLRVTDTKTGRIFSIKGLLPRDRQSSAPPPSLHLGGDPSRTQAFGTAGNAATLMDFAPSSAMTAILASASASAGLPASTSTIPDASFFDGGDSLEAQIRAVVESTRPAAPPPAAPPPAAPPAPVVAAPVPAPVPAAPPPAPAPVVAAPVAPPTPSSFTLPTGGPAFEAPAAPKPEKGTDLAYPIASEPLTASPPPPPPAAKPSPAASGGAAIAAAAVAGVAVAAASSVASAASSVAPAVLPKSAAAVSAPLPTAAVASSASAVPAAASLAAAPAASKASASTPQPPAPPVPAAAVPTSPKAAGVLAQPPPAPPKASQVAPQPPPAPKASQAAPQPPPAPPKASQAAPQPPIASKPQAAPQAAASSAPQPPTQALPPTKVPPSKQETLIQPPNKPNAMAVSPNAVSLSDLATNTKYKPGMTTEILADAFMRAMEIYDYGEDRQAAMTFVVELAMNNVNASGGAVLLTDLNSPLQELWFEVAIGPSAAQLMNFRIPMGQGLVGYSAQEGVSLLVADVQQESRFQSDIMRELGLTPGSVLCVPIQHQKRVLGAIQLYNQQGQRPFTQGELSIVNYLAHIAGEYLIRLV